MSSLLKASFLIYFFQSISTMLFCQEEVSSKDVVNNLYQKHQISFELKNNEKKGHVFVDYLQDDNYQYEIALIDRIPVRVIDSEDILKITIKDHTPLKNVIQNTFDKGINDIQDFDKKIVQEFSKVISTKESVSLKPDLTFDQLKRKVYGLQLVKK